MKKLIIVIFLLFALLMITLSIGIKQYSRNIDNKLSQKEQKIRPTWKNVLDLTNMRLRIINDLYKKYNCDNKHMETIDSIIIQKKSSEDYMKKNFHPLELKANIILLKLYNCKDVNKTLMDSLLRPYNYSLNIKIKKYNSLVDSYNNEIFSFPNTFFIDYERHKSKRFVRIDYSNSLEIEVKKQSEVENWIETGDLPNK